MTDGALNKCKSVANLPLNRRPIADGKKQNSASVLVYRNPNVPKSHMNIFGKQEKMQR